MLGFVSYRREHSRKIGGDFVIIHRILSRELQDNNARREYKKANLKITLLGSSGTGKTSLAIEINQLLRKKFKIIFIKKNYENQLDEINLLNNKGNIISSNTRKNALITAVNKKYQLAILDDGLQQKNINYDLKIVCFNSEYALGNEYLLPAGPLRAVSYTHLTLPTKA